METDVGQGATGTGTRTGTGTELISVGQANPEMELKLPTEADVADAPWNCSTTELSSTQKMEAVPATVNSLASSQIETASCRTVEGDKEKPVTSFTESGRKRGKEEERAGWENCSPTVQRNGDAHSNDASEIIQEKTNERSSEPDFDTRGEDMSETKNSRLKWTRPLREKFKAAVAELGGVMKATPKKILEVIDTPGLSLWQVKSFLQKYRKYQQTNESSCLKEEGSEVAGGEGEGERCGQSGKRKRREEKREETEGKRGKEGEEVPSAMSISWETTLKIQMDVMREVQALLQEQCAMQAEIEQQHGTLVRMLKAARKVAPDSSSPSLAAPQPTGTGVVSPSARPVPPPLLAVPTVPSSLLPPPNVTCQCTVQSTCATCALPSPATTSANVTCHTHNSKGWSPEAITSQNVPLGMCTNGLFSNKNSVTCPSPLEVICPISPPNLSSLSPPSLSPPTPLTSPHSSLGGSMVPNAGFLSSPHDQSQPWQMPYTPLFLQQSQQSQPSQQSQHYPNQHLNQHFQVQHHHIQIPQMSQNHFPMYQMQSQVQHPFQQQLVQSENQMQSQMQIHSQNENQNQVPFQNQILYQHHEGQIQHFQYAQHHNPHQMMSFAQISPSQLVSPSQLSPSQLPPSQLSPSQISSSQLSPSHLSPSQLTPSQLSPSMDMRQTHLPPQNSGLLLKPWSYDSSMTPSSDFRHPNLCPPPSGNLNVHVAPNMESKEVNLSWQMSSTDSPIPVNLISPPFPQQSMPPEEQRSQSQATSSLGNHITEEELQRGPHMDQDLENLLFQSNVGSHRLTKQRTEACVNMELEDTEGTPHAEAVWAKERELQECLTEGKREGEGDEKELGGGVGPLPALLSLPPHVSFRGNNLSVNGTGDGNGNVSGNVYGNRDSSVKLNEGAPMHLNSASNAPSLPPSLSPRSPSPPLCLPHFPPFLMNERNSSPLPMGVLQETGINLPPTPLTLMGFQQMQLAALQQGRDFLNMATGCPPGLQESLWEKMKQQAYLQLLQRQVNLQATGNGNKPNSQNGNIVQMVVKDVCNGMDSTFLSSSPSAPQPPLTFVNNYSTPSPSPSSLPLQSVETYGHQRYLIGNSNSMTGVSGMGKTTTTFLTTGSEPMLNPVVVTKGNTGVPASGLSSSSSSGSANDAQEAVSDGGNKRADSDAIISSMETMNCTKKGGESGEGQGGGGRFESQNLGALANALQTLTQQCQEILMPHCRVGGWKEKVLS